MSEQFKKIHTKEEESDLNEKHVPVVETNIQGESTEIYVKIGEIEHPSEPVHFIQWIEILDGDLSLEKVYLSHFNKPEIIFYTKENPKKLIVRTFCNVHGFWQYS